MDDQRALLLACHRAALAAVDPAAAVTRSLAEAPLALDGVRRIVVVGAGKAAAAMAQAVEAHLGDRICGGVVVVKDGHGLTLSRILLREASHPLPDERGAAAARELIAAVSGMSADDLVLAVLSGGASALLPAPIAGLTLADKQAVNHLLLASGLDITAINALRKRWSRIKGGGLVRAAHPARIEAFILSDVLGDDLATIASGPTVGDPTTWADIEALLRRANLHERLPPAVRAFVARGLAGAEPETAKPGDPLFARVNNRLVASNGHAVRAAAAAAQAAGYEPVVLAEPLTGDVLSAAEMFCRQVVTLAAGGSRRRMLIAGGEPTVTLSANPGHGGRAQMFAVAAAGKLAGHQGITVLAASTDGTDGPTDAAGAFADGSSSTRAAVRGIDLGAALRTHDAYPALAALGDLLITGPTLTNVADVYFAAL